MRAALSHARPRATAFVAALAWLALALGPTAKSLHAADVGHRVCPEHGELVHVEHAESVAGRYSAPRGAARLHADSPTGHAHEHCVPSLTERPRSTLTSRGDSFSAVPGVSRPGPRADAPRARARARYRLAPKGSPPA